MSFVGTGGEDWVELDLDLFERSRTVTLDSVLTEARDRVARAIGSDFEVQRADGGLVFIVVDGVRRYRAEMSHDNRLIVTGPFDPEGPL